MRRPIFYQLDYPEKFYEIYTGLCEFLTVIMIIRISQRYPRNTRISLQS